MELEKYCNDKQLEHLDTIIDGLNAKLEDISYFEEERYYIVMFLAHVYINYYEAVSDTEWLEQSIELLEDHLKKCPITTRYYASMVYRTALSYLSIYENSFNEIHLHKALEHFEYAFNECDEDSNDYIPTGYFFAKALFLNFERVNDIKLLETCISLLNYLVEHRNFGSIHESDMYLLFGKALTAQYYRSSVLYELLAAINFIEPKLACYSEYDANGAELESLLADAYSELYRLKSYELSSEDYYDKTFAYASRPLQKADGNLDAWPFFLLNAAKVIYKKLMKSKVPSVLEEGAAVVFSDDYIEDMIRTILGYTLQSLGEIGPEVPGKIFCKVSSGWSQAMCLAALGYLFKGERDKNLEDIDKAIDFCTRILSVCKSSSLGVTEANRILGRAYELKFSITSDRRLLNESLKTYRLAAESASESYLIDALMNCCTWLNCAFENELWQEVIDAFHYSRAIIDNLVIAERKSDNYRYEEINKSARDTAFASVMGGNLSALIQQHIQRYTNHTMDIKSKHHLKYWVHCTQGIGDRAAFAAAKLGQLKEAAVIMEYCLSKYDENEERFLPKNRAAEIKEAAKELPLLYMGTTSKGGFGIFICGHTDELQLLWFPELTTAFLDDLLFGTLKGYGIVFTPSGEDYNDSIGYIKTYYHFSRATISITDENNKSKRYFSQCLKGLISKLSALTGKKMAQVLQGHESIIIIPSGYLRLLPLGIAAEDNLHSNIDNINFIYAPSALQIRRAQKIRDSAAEESILAVNGSFKNTDLKLSEHEISIISSFFPKYILLDNITDEEQLFFPLTTASSIFHFSGHAYLDYDEPLMSKLLLSDNAALSIKVLLSRKIKMRLAVLSGCETSIIYRNFPDESISIANSFMTAGAAGVIGTLWQVSEISTSILMIKFYDLWLNKKEKPYRALHLAKLWLRDSEVNDFISYLKSLLDKSNKAEKSVKKVLQTFLESNPEGKCYSSPYYWAGFIYNGV